MKHRISIHHNSVGPLDVTVLYRHCEGGTTEAICSMRPACRRQDCHGFSSLACPPLVGIRDTLPIIVINCHLDCNGEISYSFIFFLDEKERKNQDAPRKLLRTSHFTHSMRNASHRNYMARSLFLWIINKSDSCLQTHLGILLFLVEILIL